MKIYDWWIFNAPFYFFEKIAGRVCVVSESLRLLMIMTSRSARRQVSQPETFASSWRQYCLILDHDWSSKRSLKSLLKDSSDSISIRMNITLLGCTIFRFDSEFNYIWQMQLLWLPSMTRVLYVIEHWQRRWSMAYCLCHFRINMNFFIKHGFIEGSTRDWSFQH